MAQIIFPQEHPRKMWTPAHTRCENNRSIEGLWCGKDIAGTRFPMIFHPEKKECVHAWEVPRKNHGFMPECREEDKAGYYLTPESDKVYYKCPGSEVFFCEEGESFNAEKQTCVKAAAATTSPNKESGELTTSGEGLMEPTEGSLEVQKTTLLKVLEDSTPSSE